MTVPQGSGPTFSTSSGDDGVEAGIALAVDSVGRRVGGTDEFRDNGGTNSLDHEESGEADAASSAPVGVSWAFGGCCALTEDPDFGGVASAGVGFRDVILAQRTEGLGIISQSVAYLGALTDTAGIGGGIGGTLGDADSEFHSDVVWVGTLAEPIDVDLEMRTLRGAVSVGTELGAGNALTGIVDEDLVGLAAAQAVLSAHMPAVAMRARDDVASSQDIPDGAGLASAGSSHGVSVLHGPAVGKADPSCIPDKTRGAHTLSIDNDLSELFAELQAGLGLVVVDPVAGTDGLAGPCDLHVRWGAHTRLSDSVVVRTAIVALSTASIPEHEELRSTDAVPVGGSDLVGLARYHAHTIHIFLAVHAFAGPCPWVEGSLVGASGADPFDFVETVLADTAGRGVYFIDGSADVVAVLSNFVVSASVGALVADSPDQVVPSVAEAPAVAEV